MKNQNIKFGLAVNSPCDYCGKKNSQEEKIFFKFKIVHTSCQSQIIRFEQFFEKFFPHVTMEVVEYKRLRVQIEEDGLHEITTDIIQQMESLNFRICYILVDHKNRLVLHLKDHTT